MKIEILERFSHHGVVYHKGELREVSEMDAGYFCGCGWAVVPGQTPSPRDTGPRKLEIQNSKIGTSSTTPGVK